MMGPAASPDIAIVNTADDGSSVVSARQGADIGSIDAAPDGRTVCSAHNGSVS